MHKQKMWIQNIKDKSMQYINNKYIQNMINKWV